MSGRTVPRCSTLHTPVNRTVGTATKYIHFYDSCSTLSAFLKLCHYTARASVQRPSPAQEQKKWPCVDFVDPCDTGLRWENSRTLMAIESTLSIQSIRKPSGTTSCRGELWIINTPGAITKTRDTSEIVPRESTTKLAWKQTARGAYARGKS